MVPQRVKKRVSDTDLVNIGQLDHYVVFGTKFGPVQDVQRGKKGRIQWAVRGGLGIFQLF